MMNRKICAWIDKTFYPNYTNRWDDLLFGKELIQHLSLDVLLLDLGAGSGTNHYMNFRGKVARVVGVDPDPSVLQNPFLDEAKIGKGENIPYKDREFHIIISVNTLEHLDNPEYVFKEVYRVLKPGGLFMIKTPNKRHYVPLISRLTPMWFHKFWNKMRGVEEKDVFPTKYKANDSRGLFQLVNMAGFAVISMELYEGRPEYLRIFWPLYFIGLIYERIVNQFSSLKNFRSIIIATFRKS